MDAGWRGGLDRSSAGSCATDKDGEMLHRVNAREAVSHSLVFMNDLS